MTPMRDLMFPVERLTPAGAHCFFGYYDNPAWDAAGQRHLCHHVPFWGRLPTGNDTATLGIIRLADRAFIPLCETNAWNFQQGTMLQWHPLEPNESVIFNRFVGGRYVGVVRRVATGEELLLSQPVASVDPAGRHALSINFSRNFDFRPGYGYANKPDDWKDTPAPKEDGIFLIHLATGESELIVSYDDLARCFTSEARGRKLVVNHIAFNTDGTRFVALLRTFPDAAHKQWATALITADWRGRDRYLLRNFGIESHYHWRDPGHLLIWSDAGGAASLYLLTDRTQEAETVDPAFFARDGHCSYSPDRRWLLYDSYPIDNYRYLYAYNLEERRAHTLGGFYSAPAAIVDIRCDLHPRWNRAGTAVSFDSTHESYRAIYQMDVSSLVTDGRR